MSITAVLSSYAIRGSYGLHRWFERGLEIIGFGTRNGELNETPATDDHTIVLLGYHRTACELVAQLEATRPDLMKKLLVVDYNTDLLKDLKKRGVAVAFGDLASADTLHHLNLDRTRLIVSTIPDMLLKGTDNLKLAKTCTALAPDAHFVALADHAKHEQRLLEAGAGSVILHHNIIAERLIECVTRQAEA
jgi:Trk K+ transport system NAD-binding subunit